MRSQIYEGRIEHHRYRPVTHDLSYPVYIYAFDLDELETLNQRYPFFGYNRAALTSIRDRDYLQADSRPVREKILDLLLSHQVDAQIDTIIMVTSARYFNYVFNPVSFHYCFSKDRKLAAIVAEVNNTFGERHPYVLTNNTSGSGDWFAAFEAPKQFHVSPFNTVEGTYYFYFTDLGPCLKIRIELVKEGRKIMAAELSGSGRPLTRANHIKTMLKYPLAPHLSIPRIYAHAFKLFFRKKLAYHPKPVPQSKITMKKQRPGFVEALCMRLVFIAFKQIRTGCLILVLPDGRSRRFGDCKAAKPAKIEIKAYQFFPRVIFEGEIGFGEAFMDALWETPDLVALSTLLIENQDALSKGRGLLSYLKRTKERIAHEQRRNTIKNTPKNIQAHYDLSNAFYERFLDQQMLYSCGIFKNETDSLEKAQEEKMMRILTQADIQAHHHILEIGCGWGGFAVFAAKQTGCRVTGITVSKAQYERACQRVKEAGLEDRITILLQDYRHTTGEFDRIVSIEMIEAVGPQFFSVYFKQGQALLKPGGIMVFQAIIIADDRYENYCRETDWIQKHIFPGGHLPSLGILEQTVEGCTDFKISDVFHMGPHYATTLAHWQKRFLAEKKEVSQMGFDDIFCRKWIYYFSVCEAGFRVGRIDDIQVTLTL